MVLCGSGAILGRPVGNSGAPFERQRVKGARPSRAATRAVNAGGLGGLPAGMGLHEAQPT